MIGGGGERGVERGVAEVGTILLVILVGVGIGLLLTVGTERIGDHPILVQLLVWATVREGIVQTKRGTRKGRRKGRNTGKEKLCSLRAKEFKICEF